MIRKIKTDNINIDILFNEIAQLRAALRDERIKNYELQLRLHSIEDVTLPLIKRLANRSIEDLRLGYNGGREDN